MSSNNKTLLNIFSSKINGLKEEKIYIENSISNIVGSNKLNMKRYSFSLDDKDYDVLIKHSSPKIILNGVKILSSGKLSTALGLLNNHRLFDYDKSNLREKKIYENIDESFRRIMIPYYGSYKNDMVLKNIRINNRYDYKEIIKEITKLHIFYYGKKEIVSLFQLNNQNIKDYKKAKKILIKMYSELENRIDKELRIEEFINNIDQYLGKYIKHQTLTHNDFSTRNIFMDDEQLYIYDWELAAYQNPEHDLIELLAYSLEQIDTKEVKEIIRMYRKELYSKINVKYNDQEYKEILINNLKKFIAIRLTMLRIANKKIKMDFIDILINNCNKLYYIIEETY